MTTTTTTTTHDPRPTTHDRRPMTDDLVDDRRQATAHDPPPMNSALTAAVYSRP